MQRHLIPAALKYLRHCLKCRDFQWAGKHLYRFFNYHIYAFNQSIQLDSIKTGKQILSKFRVPSWKHKLVAIGNRNRCHVSAVIQSRADCLLFLIIFLSTSKICRPQGGTPNGTDTQELCWFHSVHNEHKSTLTLPHHCPHLQPQPEAAEEDEGASSDSSMFSADTVFEA